MRNRSTRFLLGCLAAFIGAQPVWSQSQSEDYVSVGNEPLGDEDFFRAVTCGAPPNGACKGPAAKWSRKSASDLTIRIVTTSNAAATTKRIRMAIDKASAELNAVTPGLSLSIMEEDDKRDPKILLLISDFMQGDRISETGSDLDGSVIEAAAFNVEWDSQRRITKATIVFTQNLLNAEIPSIVLEELAQALGPIHDIRGKYYEKRSVFSQDGNLVSKLGEQDRYVIQRLYGKMTFSTKGGDL